jgi:hypothetical protein
VNRVHHARRKVRCNVRMVPAGSEEARMVELENALPEKGFCHECEDFVDEKAGKLHRATCKVAPERRGTRNAAG